MTLADDLVLSHFSLGRYLDFEQRVAAAANAGYVGIGLWFGDYVRMRSEGRSDADLRAILDHHGLRVMEFEALRGWAADGDVLATSREHEDTIFRMADALGPGGSFQVLGPYPGSLEQAAESLAALCDRAADHGLRGAIEFPPEMTNIPDAHSAWDLDFDLPAFIRTIDAVGSTAPWSVEVLSIDLENSETPVELARHFARRTRELLADVRSAATP